MLRLSPAALNAGLGCSARTATCRSPQLDTHAERMIGTLRRECLNHMFILAEDNARRLSDEFARHHDGERTHEALGPESSVTARSSPWTNNRGRTRAVSTVRIDRPRRQAWPQGRRWGFGTHRCTE